MVSTIELVRNILFVKQGIVSVMLDIFHAKVAMKVRFASILERIIIIAVNAGMRAQVVKSVSTVAVNKKAARVFEQRRSMERLYKIDRRWKSVQIAGGKKAVCAQRIGRLRGRI